MISKYSSKLRGLKLLRWFVKVLPENNEFYLRRVFFGSCYGSIDKEKKMLFIHIPKSAGSSVSEAIYGSPTYKHDHVCARRYKWEDEGLFDQCFKVTLVRNPWHRLYSAYNYLKNVPATHKNTSEWSKDNMGKYQTFEQFVLDLPSSKLYKVWMHLKPQYTYVCDSEGRLLVDLVGRVESMSEFELSFSEMTGIDLKIGHVNKTKLEKNTSCLPLVMSSVYSAEMSSIVRELYKKDFELFGYPHEP